MGKGMKVSFPYEVLFFSFLEGKKVPGTSAVPLLADLGDMVPLAQRKF